MKGSSVPHDTETLEVMVWIIHDFDCHHITFVDLKSQALFPRFHHLNLMSQDIQPGP